MARGTNPKLIEYLRVEQAIEREIMYMLRRSAAKIDKELKRLPAGTVRRSQLIIVRNELNREIASLWNKIGSTVMEGRTRAAILSAKQIADEIEPHLKRMGVPKARLEYYRKSLEQGAKTNIEAAMQRMNMIKHPLSTRVYRSRTLVNGQVDRLINTHLARGSSAREFAAEVRKFVSPRSPGGVRYAAQRLARTEINNAYHAVTVREAINDPFTEGLRWVLSGSHPRPDECDEYANDNRGLGEGVFRPNDVPAKPHPNCLCFTEPVVPSREEFIKNFKAGKYNDWLDDQED